MTIDVPPTGDTPPVLESAYFVPQTAATQPTHTLDMTSPGGAGGGPVVYWMPMVNVPFASTMGQVNLAWAPSQDPYGKDLPVTGEYLCQY